MQRDLYHSLSPAISLAPAARTASANGTGVDLTGFLSAMVEIVTGTITDGTHTFAVEESDDNSAFTAVADANLLGTEPAIVAADDNVVKRIGYLGSKQYLRVSVTVATATTGGIYGATILRGHPRHGPVA